MFFLDRWAIFNAILNSSIFAILFHSLLHSRFFMIKVPVVVYYIPSILILLRLLVPLDSPFFYIVHSYIFLPTLNDFFERTIISNISLGSIIHIIWLGGFLFFLFRWLYLVISSNKIIFLLKINSKKATSDYFTTISSLNINPKKVLFNKDINEVMTVGFFDYYILLPDIQYTDKELKFILSHEYYHIHFKDILVLNIIHIFSCFFWWNPLIKLIEHDLALLMEFRCDEYTTKFFSVSEKLEYTDSLIKMIKLNHDNNITFRKINFSLDSPTSPIILRAFRIIDGDYSKQHTFWSVILLEFILFITSYFFILQPYYNPNNFPIEDEILVDETNSFIKKDQSDYFLYIDGESWGKISKEELLTQPYCNLKIVE